MASSAVDGVVEAAQIRGRARHGGRGEEGMKKHGLSRSKIYRIWTNMKSRCMNPNVASFDDYGGRGIRVCDAWMDFLTFYRDMGSPPHGKTLDRIDNDGPYSPANCRWADSWTQWRNTRRTSQYSLNGLTMALCEWEAQLGCSHRLLSQRLYRGKSFEEAIKMGAGNYPQRRNRNVKCN